MKNKIEKSVTTISFIASIIGMFIIGMKTWQFINEHIGEAIRFFERLF
ncbi:hypothetical protein ACH0B5_14370 [Ureibacillus sp. 179-F W5.1 NHS]|nr:hypothetical protein [Lysinibacillus halotolerans]